MSDKTSKHLDAVNQAIAATNQKRTNHLHQMEARYTLADGVRVFTQLWSGLMKEHFSTYPPMPVSPSRHVPRIKRSIVQPLKDAGIKVSEFMNFLFENWKAVRRSTRFSKFKYYPDVPALDWVLKFSDMYIAEFMEHRGGDYNPVEAESVKTKAAPVAKIVNAAKRDIEERDREIARLRAENKSLQSKDRLRINTYTAKRPPKKRPTSKTPEWD